MRPQEIEDTVLNQIERDRDDHVHFLEALVRLPSIAGQEPFAQELVIDRFHRLDGLVEAFPPDTDRIKAHPEYNPLSDEEWSQAASTRNAAVTLEGTGGGRSLLMYAHVDTEPVHQPPAWVYPPFLPHTEGTRMYGLGTADAKAAIAALLSAIEAVRRCEVQLGGDLTMLSTFGKRGGSAGTLAAFLRGYRADGCLYCHSPETGHGLGELKLSTTGVAQFRIVVQGLVPDAWEVNTPETGPVHLGVNSIAKAVPVIQALEGLADRRARRLGQAEDGFPRATLNIGVVRAGTAPGEVPAACELHCRINFMEEETIEIVRQEVEETLASLARVDAWLQHHPPHLEMVGLRANPAAIHDSHPLAEMVRGCLRDIGVVPSRHYRHAASDIRIPILYADTPTVGYGPLAGNFFGPNEWVDLEDYTRTIKVTALAIMRWCGTV